MLLYQNILQINSATYFEIKVGGFEVNVLCQEP